ncbi:ArdC-like ssDNA-binding domain-containing protein [Streptococcus sanguinis]|uniref:ArdC-like ssDNA-binding domain-containing protein n=1 Tax=Streptococcus sanguinis TaxID=1305 RepID=UPI0007793E56|nr:ArdC-like ssDNA-binding domain-containing protein [Streptococcus sanguinis]
MARVEELKKLSILDVAEALGMELKRQGTDRYVWVEHESFVISPRRNIFSWFSRDVKGDVIKLVQTIREEQTGTRPSFKTAKHFLEVGEFPEVDMTAAPAPKLAFEYRHERYEHTNPSWTKDYLRRERKLSEDTITFFFQQGNIAEISHKMNDYSEPAIVFKFKNSQGKVMGASLQGIVENREKYPDRGYLKRILKNSDGLTGFYADVGRPKRLIFAESPIDVMSYYQLHPQLQDVRLVAMDGLKEGIMSFRFAELVSELQGKTYEPGERTARVLEATAKTSTFFQSNEVFITLAVDNDSAGWNFISKLQEKGIPFKLDIPPIAEKGVEKADWNSFLKEPLQGQAELVHIYSYDKKKKAAAYQGYFSKELATAKVAQLTAGDMVAFSASETLSWDEIEEIATNHQSQTYQQLSKAKEGLREEVPQTLNIWAGTNENTLLSNLAPSLLVIDGFSYESVEHAYQTLKSGKINAKAYSWAEKNRAAFKAGQKVQSDRVLGPADTSKNILLMEKLLKERYQQDTSFRQVLDATRGKVLTHEQDQGVWRIEFPRILMKIRDREHSIKENQMAENNIDVIQKQATEQEMLLQAAQQEEFLHSLDKDKFLKGLELIQKYSVSEVLSRPPIYQGDDQRLEALQIDLEGFDYKPLDDFIRQYIDPNYDLDYEEFAVFSDYEEFAVFSDAWNNFFRNGAGKDLTVDSFITLAKNNGLVDEVPVVEPWQAITVLEPIKTYSVKNGELQEDFDSVSGLLEFVKQNLSETERHILEQELAEDDRGTPTDILMTIDSALVGDFDVYVNGQSIISVYPNNIDEQATELKVRTSEEVVHRDMMQQIQQDEENYLNAIDKENFTGIVKLVQEYDSEIVFLLSESDQEVKQRLLQENLDIEPVREFAERYLGIQNDGLRHEKLASLTADILIAKAVEKGVLDKENFPKVFRVAEQKKPTIDQLIQDRDLKGLSAHMKEGVKNYFNSDTYKAFLNTMSKLNNYSLNNLFLIVAQNPKASAVASFKAWKSFDRHVKKGEKALKIWAPYQVTRKDEKGKPVLNKKGQEVKDTRFRLVPVFDVSQTEGKELPQPVYELEGTHQDYANLYRAAKETAAAKGIAFEISREPMEAHGFYSPTDSKIVIRAGMSERETLSTIFHEMAHADLHNPKSLEGQHLTRTTKELQAESVAYVVANHYGLDTSSYSFGYLAGWSKEPDSLADLEAQLSIVQQEAKDLIQRLDTAFEKYQSKEVSKDPLSQKLEHFNEKCQQKMAEKAANEAEKKPQQEKGDEEKMNLASM